METFIKITFGLEDVAVDNAWNIQQQSIGYFIL